MFGSVLSANIRDGIYRNYFSQIFEKKTPLVAIFYEKSITLIPEA